MSRTERTEQPEIEWIAHQSCGNYRAVRYGAGRRWWGTLAAAVLMLGAQPAVAAGRAVELSAGLEVESVRDDLLVPLAFSGPGAAFGVGLVVPLGPGTLVSRAGFGFAVVFDRLGFFGGALRYGADVSWLVPLGSSGVDLGLTLALDTRVNYFYRWDDAHSYWLGTQWLGPAVRARRSLGHSLSLTVLGQLAAVGFAGRPPPDRLVKQEGVDRFAYYFSAPHTDERLVSVDRLQLFRLEGALEWSSGWALVLQLRSTSSQLSAPTFALSATAAVRRTIPW